MKPLRIVFIQFLFAHRSVCVLRGYSEVLLERKTARRYLLSQRFADVANVPRFVHKARGAFLALRKSYDKAVVCAVFRYPLRFLSAVKA